MKIGCFALVLPFAPMERQFQLIREMGIDFADITDNHDGGMLGVEYGFAASISLDSITTKNPSHGTTFGHQPDMLLRPFQLTRPASPGYLRYF